MPYLTPAPEQRRRLQALVAKLQEQDQLITVVAEALLAGYSQGATDVELRFVRVTPDGRIEMEIAGSDTGPKLVEDDSPDEAA